VFTQEERGFTAWAWPTPSPPRGTVRSKEAVSKAFTTGIGKELGWKSISIRRGERGEPHVVLDEQGRVLLEKVGGTEVLISLSHTENYGHAVALLVKA
jgi:holo-[acyl-carrier protein] synthase